MIMLPPERAMDFVTVLSGIFALIGAAMLVLAGRQLAKRRAFLRGSTTAPGKIVAVIEVPQGIEVSYFPKVAFRTAAGRKVTFQSEVGGSGSHRRIGEKVTVRYLPDQPHRAEIDSFLSLWLPTLVFSVLGGALALVGLGILFGMIPV
ncbi:MAG: DUF3592 domain-containing protein [Chromatiales bacterium]